MSDVEVSKKAIAKELLERGKKNGMLSFKEIMDAFEVVDIGPDQIDKIYETIEKAGIEIVGDIDKELEEIELRARKKLRIYRFRKESTSTITSRCTSRRSARSRCLTRTRRLSLQSGWQRAIRRQNAALRRRICVL